MTIIYSDFGDDDTRILQNIWNGMDDITVVHVSCNKVVVTKDGEIAEEYGISGNTGIHDFVDKLNETIDNYLQREEDTIIGCGHGTPFGLLSPAGMGGYLIDDINAVYLRGKRVIGIWCNANWFAVRHNLTGFYTGMFISNTGEAAGMNIMDSNQDDINKMSQTFMSKINGFLKKNTELSEWKPILQESYDRNDKVSSYNYEHLYNF